jgi:tetratricopeptide (TPR) repeat protein
VFRRVSNYSETVFWVPDHLHVNVHPVEVPLVGRDATIAAAWHRLAGGAEGGPAAADVALLSGLPGVGKRALANAIALTALNTEDGHHAFPMGVLSATIGSNLVDWLNELGGWARLLGVDPDTIGAARQRKRPEQLLSAIDEALADARALLVFNDVRDEHDAAHFKDVGFNCQRLYTTRYFAVARAVTSRDGVVQVEPLDADASHMLLSSLAPDAARVMSQDLSRLVEVIDGIPLALQIVGRHLDEAYYTGGVPTARAFLDKLRDAHDLLSLGDTDTEELTLRAVLDVTARDLSPSDVEALSYLTVFPPRSNDFSREAALTVTEDPGSLDRLRGTGLLELSRPDLGRYALHRVIGEYARDIGHGNEVAYRRMAEYFLGYLTAPPTDPPAREEWLANLDYEGDNLREVLRWTVDSKEAQLGLQLMAKLWPFWYHRSQFRRGREVARQLLSMETPTDADTAYWVLRSQLLNDDGNFAYNMAEFGAAEARHRAALEIRERLGDDLLQAGSWNNLGLVERERGELSAAEHHFTAARDVNRAPGGRRLWLAMNINNLGLLAEWQGAFADATALQEEAIAIFESVGEPWGVAMAGIDRATALLWSGATRNGERALVGALADRWQVRDTKAMASALRGLGLVASLGEQHADARTYIETAFVLSSGITDRLGQARSLELLVPVLSAAMDHRKSLAALGCLDAFQTSTGAVLPAFRRARLEEAIDGIKRQLQTESDWIPRSEATSNSIRDGELDLRFGYGPASHAASPNELIPSILENASD